MAKGEKNALRALEDAAYSACKPLIGLFSGVLGSTAIDLFLHEASHIAVAKALGYNSELYLGIDEGHSQVIGNPSNLEYFLITSAGPVASGIVSIASLLAFLKLKKSPLKDFAGGVAVESSYNNVANALNMYPDTFINDCDLMALSLEEMGYGKIGEALPVLPLAVLAYCSYNVGKHYLSAYKDYKKSKATLQTDKSLEKVISDNVFVKDNSTQK